ELVWRTGREGLKKLSPQEIARVAPLYRDLCADLSWAQAARYTAALTDYLGGLTAAAHTLLYGPFARRRRTRARLADALGAFPRAVRAHRRAMLLAALLFFLPLAGGMLASLNDPSFAFRIVPEAMLRPLTEAYAKGFGEARGAGDDAAMAGFYVNNN